MGFDTKNVQSMAVLSNTIMINETVSIERCVLFWYFLSIVCVEYQ